MPTILWNHSDIVSALPGISGLRPFQATGVSIDTRTMKPGDLFIALKGENFDGHDFVSKACELGAAAVIVDHLPADLPPMFPTIQVQDTLIAMEMLAKFARKRFKGKIVGLTGSLGKTTSKTMLAYLLDAFGSTYATEGNLNNHIGVPLTLMRMPVDSQYAVIEMGMNHTGEIRHIANITRPHIAFITTIEAVHLEYLGSMENIAKAKSEIFEGLLNHGTAIVPFDSPFLPIMDITAHQWGAKEFLTFGEIIRANIRLLDYSQDRNGSHIKVDFFGKIYEYQLSIHGKHNAMNSLGVLAAIHALKLDVEKAMRLLQAFSAIPGRGKLHHLQLKNIKFSLCDDSYNASPASVRAAITQLSHTKGRKIAVLGDMLELGSHALGLHTDLARDIIKNKIDLVCTSGHFMRHLHAALPHSIQGPCADNADLLYPQILACLKNGDTLLVKGSHGSLVHTIVKRLLQEATPIQS